MLLGQVLQLIVPLNIAAAASVFVALIWGQRNDVVSKHFKTDVDRILEPNDAVKVLGMGGLIIGMLAAALAAPLVGVMLAGPVGILTCVIFVYWIVR